MSDANKCYAWSMRLVKELAELRAALCECSQVIAAPKVGDDQDYIVHQVKTLVGNVECMAGHASEAFAKIEPQITENAARMAIARPDGWLTNTAMVIDIAWRSIHQITRQWSQPDAPADAVLHRFAKCADMLAAFDDVEPWATRITTEMRSATMAPVIQPTDPPADPWILVELADCKFDRSTMLRHSRQVEKSGVRKPEGTRGKYEIRRSRLAEYLDVRHRRKYGIE